MRQAVLVLFALGLFSSCLEEQELKLTYEGYTPKQLNDGWAISSPADENLDEGLLEQAFLNFYSAEKFPMGESLLVFRNGKLVAEAYAKDKADGHRLNNIQSCTKSVTSMLTGVALQDRLITNLNQSLYSFYPEAFGADNKKVNITLRNCLSMQGGLDFDNGIHTEELFHTPGSSLQYILGRPMVHDAGTIHHYNDGLPHLVGAAIAKAAGKSLEQFAQEKLFAPLGIQEYKWERAKDGINFGAFSLHLKPRDLAKLGQLCLQNGEWEGEQLISPSYLEEAVKVQSGSNTPYGYYFWLLPAFRGYAMKGHGGQFVFMCPEKDLLIVYTAFPYTDRSLWTDEGKLIEPIFRACK
jgi:CubicO group peptidase (beta-lactamase class C family)